MQTAVKIEENTIENEATFKPLQQRSQQTCLSQMIYVIIAQPKENSQEQLIYCYGIDCLADMLKLMLAININWWYVDVLPIGLS